MTGHVLAFSVKEGTGIISGSNGQRYTFAASEWNAKQSPSPGMYVDFEVDGRAALSIYPLPEGASAGDSAQAEPAVRNRLMDATDRDQNLEPHRSAVTDAPLTQADKERVRSDEVRRAAEQKYRDEVRQQLRDERHWSDSQGFTGGREMAKPEIWPRVLAMLKLEPGIVQEIASDPRSTKQGLIVLVLAETVSSLLAFPLIPIFVPLLFVGIVINAGTLCLTSRLFSKQVPEYRKWLRALMFATAPLAVGIIPILGSVVGAIYYVVIEIVVARDLARVTLGRAGLIVALPVLIMGVVGAVLFFLLAAAATALLTGLLESLQW